MEDRGADLARRTCNLELLFFVSLSCIESFSYKPFSKIYPFLSPTLMAQSAWKNCSHKLFIVILHLRTLMPLIGLLWLTNSIFRSLFYIFSSFWRLFFFLPALLQSDIEPLPVGVLSCLTPVHIFAVPSPPPPDNELLTEYIIRAVVLFVVVLASKKRDELLMMTDKKEKKKRGKNLLFLGLLLSAAAPSRGLWIRP